MDLPATSNQDTPPGEIAAEQAPPESAEGPVQFGIRGLLLLQAAVAVFLAALLAIGHFALLLALLATVWLMILDVRPRRVPLKRLAVNLMGGVAMPCLCVVYDPFVFRPDGSLGMVRSYDDQALIYLLLAFQMLVFLTWVFFGSRLPRLGGLFAGSMYAGALLAAGVGIALLAYSVVGLSFMLLGALGLTPFLTLCVYFGGAQRAMRQLRGVAGPRAGIVSVWAGMALAVALPIVLYSLVGTQLARALALVSRPQLPFFAP